MKKILVSIIFTALSLAGCGTTETTSATNGDAHMTTITGDLTYLQRIALIPGGTATITLIDTSTSDSVAPQIAEVVIDLEDQQIPIPFELVVSDKDYVSGGTYAIKAEIGGPKGSLEWTTDTVNEVDLTQSLVDVGQLVLTQVSQEDDASAAGLLAGEWSVTSIDGSPTTVEPVPTLVFDESGTLGGNASCNSYSTTYKTNGDTLTFDSEPAVTMMACGVQEQVFLQALNSIASADSAVFVIDGNKLSITTDKAMVEAKR